MNTCPWMPECFRWTGGDCTCPVLKAWQEKSPVAYKRAVMKLRNGRDKTRV